MDRKPLNFETFPRGSSFRSGGIMSLRLASDIFVIWSNRIKILQRGAHAPITAEGRGDPPRRPDRRSDVGRANFNFVRAAPPIYSSVSFRKGQEVLPPHALDSPPIACIVSAATRGTMKVELPGEIKSFADIDTGECFAFTRKQVTAICMKVECLSSASIAVLDVRADRTRNEYAPGFLIKTPTGQPLLPCRQRLT
jgi:hypothetical protein